MTYIPEHESAENFEEERERQGMLSTGLFMVVGKKDGQLVEISNLPMSKENCELWIKDTGIEMHYKNVCAIPYHGKKKEFIYHPH